MDIIVKKANINDVERIETIGKKAFHKFGLSTFGFEYNSESMRNRFTEWFNKDYCHIAIAETNNNVVGFIVLYITPTVFSDRQSQIVAILMQPDATLDKVTQGRIVLKLIEYTEDLTMKLNADMNAFSVMMKYDISGHLIRKGYKLSDLIYIKKRGGY